MIINKTYPSKEPRGTVLILCIALLVMLGMLASSFVIITLYQRSSSRSLSRADNAEQVRASALTYVRALLLEDIVDSNGRFLASEPYDTPGTTANVDPWLASQVRDSSGNWPFISNLVGGAAGSYEGVAPATLINNVGINTTGTDYDGDNDITDEGDARWIDDPGLPFANVISPDGTSYRVAIRIVDTNALANINVGMAQAIVDAGPDPDITRKKWDGQYPANFYLREIASAAGELNPENLDDGNAPVSGRYNYAFTAGQEAEELYNNLYRYLANTDYSYLNGLGIDAIRPFDIAEEVALRIQPTGTDLHPRLGALWPNTFGSVNTDYLTAYSWTMQIRPPTTVANAAAIDADLETLGYPSPAKVSLVDLIDPSDGTTEDKSACTAAYLALMAAGMSANEAAQYMVNLVDYIDSDDQIRFINHLSSTSDVIDFGLLTNAALRPTNTYYGTDSQPIISEIYVEWHYTYNGVTLQYELDDPATPANHAYGIELYNPTGQPIDLDNWDLYINGTPYTLNSPPVVPAGGFLTLYGDLGVTVSSGNQFQIAGLLITPSQAIALRRPWPSASSISAMVAIDRFDGGVTAPTTPIAGIAPPPTIVRTEYSERPGHDIPVGSGNPLEPVIAPFGALVPGTAAKALGNAPATDVGGGNGGQIILRNDALHSLGELFYVPKIANDGTDAKLIEQMETIQSQQTNDSDYRLEPGDAVATSILRNLTLRTGLEDGADNDGDNHIDDGNSATDEQIIAEARVPGLININTAPQEVLEALHYYYLPVAAGGDNIATFIEQNRPFASLGSLADEIATNTDWPAGTNPYEVSKDEDPDSDGVGSPDGIDVDNEEKLFHFKNVANLISVRSDVFVVYITVQASRNGTDVGQPLRTMAIVDRSLCLRPYDSTATAAERLADIPLPRILSQTTLP